MTRKFLVFDIGCLECCEESRPVGVYDTREDAEQAIEDYMQPGTYWGREEWHGEHSVEVFDL